MLKRFIKISILISFVVLTISSCKKEDSISNKPTSGKSTAVFNPNVTYGKMTDQDGNVYKTVTIGTQTWMAENLRTTKYNDGSAIPNVTEDDSWLFLIAGAYCNYNNTTNADTIATYGRLYNWYAVNTGKLAPKGWRVPTDAEWTTLTDYLGGTIVAGDELKEIDTTHWNSPNTGANNESGFTALPGGYRLDVFHGIGRSGFWWSDTEASNFYNAFSRDLNNSYGNITRGGNSKEFGVSVRCLRDSTTTYTTTAAFIATPTSGTVPLTVGFTDQSTNIPTSWNWDFGDGGTSSQQNPSNTYSSVGKYTVSLEVTNQYGSNTETKTNYITVKVYGDGEKGTFTDTRDNRIYNTVKIGNQIWMAENLKYLPNVTGPETESLTIPLCYVYGYYGTDVNEAMATYNYTTYGVLYNWPAAMNGEASSTANPSGVQGICPEGWHLPSDAEWTQLADYLGGETVAGGKLKEIDTTHWNSPNTGATNESGFTALPGGYRDIDGVFINVGGVGFWWSSTKGTTDNAFWRRISGRNVFRGGYRKDMGCSVRCVKD